jgi:hypothetical protein
MNTGQRAWSVKAEEEENDLGDKKFDCEQNGFKQFQNALQVLITSECSFYLLVSFQNI